MSKNRKYKPRTEAQKAARRERDRKRREAKKNNNPKAKMTVGKNVSPKVHVGVIAVANTEKKRLVKVTVIKEYAIG